jgi:hypothetical protein
VAIGQFTSSIEAALSASVCLAVIEAIVVAFPQISRVFCLFDHETKVKSNQGAAHLLHCTTSIRIQDCQLQTLTQNQVHAGCIVRRQLEALRRHAL